MKKGISIIISILMILNIFTIAHFSVEAITSGDYEYMPHIEENTFQIVGYTGTDSNLIIPNEIDGHKIVFIQPYMFEYNDNITSVKISDGIISITAFLFYNCKNLESVELPESITCIGWRGFQNCTSLTNINIPENVTVIDGFAFAGCTSLKNITLPDKLQTIDDGSFLNCSNMKNIFIPETVTNIGEHSIGFTYDESIDDFVKLEDFIIYGKADTEAEAYANTNGFTFLPIETEIFIGDVNADGKISITDATDIQKYLVQLVNFDDTQKSVSDTNGDGKVNIADVTQIQKYIAQIIKSLG